MDQQDHANAQLTHKYCPLSPFPFIQGGVIKTVGTQAEPIGGFPTSCDEPIKRLSIIQPLAKQSRGNNAKGEDKPQLHPFWRYIPNHSVEGLLQTTRFCIRNLGIVQDFELVQVFLHMERSNTLKAHQVLLLCVASFSLPTTAPVGWSFRYCFIKNTVTAG